MTRIAGVRRHVRRHLVLAAMLVLTGCGSSGGNGDHDPWARLEPRGLAVGQILGMATQMYEGPNPSWERDFEIDKLLESGLRRIRISIDWPKVEPEQDQFEWTNTDLFISLLTNAGLQVDGRLSYGVDWARPDGDDSAIRPEDFADYAAHVAEHFCGVIESYELWNEENLKIFWKPEPDPDRYGAILKATFTAVHQTCPTARVLVGGLSGFDQYTFDPGLYYFLEAMHASHPDIGQYFDAVAIHPYTFLQQTSPEWSWQGDSRELWPDIPGQIALARERLERIGAAGKPIWLTEWGWPSLLIGKANQAAFFTRGALLSIAAGVEDLDWYTFWDREGGSFPPTEDYFGLFTWSGAADGPHEKPAFRAASTLGNRLATSRFAGDLGAALALPNGAVALAFIDDVDGHLTFVGWDSVPDRTTPLDLPSPPRRHTYTCTTDIGEAACEPGIASSVPLELTGRAVYVRFDR